MENKTLVAILLAVISIVVIVLSGCTRPDIVPEGCKSSYALYMAAPGYNDTKERNVYMNCLEKQAKMEQKPDAN